MTPVRLATLREQEQYCAAEMLGALQVALLEGYSDSEVEVKLALRSEKLSEKSSQMAPQGHEERQFNTFSDSF
jgi:hypothetical protein